MGNLNQFLYRMSQKKHQKVIWLYGYYKYFQLLRVMLVTTAHLKIVIVFA